MKKDLSKNNTSISKTSSLQVIRTLNQHAKNFWWLWAFPFVVNAQNITNSQNNNINFYIVGIPIVAALGFLSIPIILFCLIDCCRPLCRHCVKIHDDYFDIQLEKERKTAFIHTVESILGNDGARLNGCNAKNRYENGNFDLWFLYRNKSIEATVLCIKKLSTFIPHELILTILNYVDQIDAYIMDTEDTYDTVIDFDRSTFLGISVDQFDSNKRIIGHPRSGIMPS